MKKRGSHQDRHDLGHRRLSAPRCKAQCKSVIGDYGIEIVAEKTYDPKDADMTAQLTKIKGAAGIQAVLNPGFGQGPRRS